MVENIMDKAKKILKDKRTVLALDAACIILTAAIARMSVNTASQAKVQSGPEQWLEAGTATGTAGAEGAAGAADVSGSGSVAETEAESSAAADVSGCMSSLCLWAAGSAAAYELMYTACAIREGKGKRKAVPVAADEDGRSGGAADGE